LALFQQGNIMSLLNSIVGAATGDQGAQGGLGSLVGALGSNPQISQVLGGLLANDGEHGGLGGLVSKFEQAGLGNVIGSWVGNGQNQPVSGEQLTQVLGSGAIGQIASKLGVDPTQAAGQLSSILPTLVNHLTPNGQVPAGGAGSTSELASLLGGLLNKA
jgi:uncharacterized protein YidB (DUF937 family)